MSKHKRPKSVASKLDQSVHIEQRDKIKDQFRIKEKFVLTEKQKAILQTGLSKETKCVLIDGIYGSSKTYLAVLMALKLVKDKKCDQVIYIRNPVESSTTGKIGFLKGDNNEKMAPYNEVFYAKIAELLEKGDADRLTKEERLVCIPLGFTRGLSWNCKAIIIDEASSMSFDDLILLLSRCGEFTKIFVVGDSINQNDIGSKAGFRKMFDLLSDEDSKSNGVFTFELRDASDIVRSGFLRFLMRKTGKIKE